VDDVLVGPGDDGDPLVDPEVLAGVDAGPDCAEELGHGAAIVLADRCVVPELHDWILPETTDIDAGPRCSLWSSERGPDRRASASDCRPAGLTILWSGRGSGSPRAGRADMTS